MRQLIIAFCLIGSYGFLSACDMTPASDIDAEALDAALAHPERPLADRARDELRKPADVLGFLQVRPGQAVLEYYGGSGWYTEILSRYLGPDGQLVILNNPAFARYYAEGIAERLAGGRLGNVEHREMLPDLVELDAARYDRALFMLSYHDLTYPTDSYRYAPDRPRLLEEIYRAMKPGGILGIVDHRAPDGMAPEESGQTLHRIDPQAVRREAMAAGFVLEARSRLLANPDDPRDKSVFALDGMPSDRFLLRFRKPEKDPF